MNKGLDIPLFSIDTVTNILHEFPSAVMMVDIKNQIIYHDKEKNGPEHGPLRHTAVHGSLVGTYTEGFCSLCTFR